MDIKSSYAVEVKNVRKLFNPTIKIYNQAVTFCIQAFENEWSVLKDINDSKIQCGAARNLIHSSKSNKAKYPEFDKLFHKMPSYCTTAVINAYLGVLNSYHSNLQNWYDEGCKGNRPTLQIHANKYPVFYKSNMYKWSDTKDAILLKLFINNDWQWVKLRLKHTDVQSIKKHSINAKISVPTLEKKHKKWFLRFAFESKAILNKTPLSKQRILAVDLGINTDAICSVMDYYGTVLARCFINHASEKDYIKHNLNRIKKYQAAGQKDVVRKLWSLVKNYNNELASKTANAIVDYARQLNVDVIVFEHLDMKGRKRGSKRQLLHMWNKNTIQRIVTHKAHLSGIRISHICARNTSKLAYDGSGYVLRGKDAGLLTYELCRFQTGKIYNCDLSASYNIGARYFIREIEKLYTGKSICKKINIWSDIQAKVPECQRRTQNTLSTLRAIHQCLAV